MSREIPFIDEREPFDITLASASTRSVCALPLLNIPGLRNAHFW